VTARKSFGSEFHEDGPAYVMARSPNLVRNRGREMSDDDEDRRPRRGRPQLTGRWRDSPGTSSTCTLIIAIQVGLTYTLIMCNAGIIYVDYWLCAIEVLSTLIIGYVKYRYHLR